MGSSRVRRIDSRWSALPNLSELALSGAIGVAVNAFLGLANPQMWHWRVLLVGAAIGITIDLSCNVLSAMARPILDRLSGWPLWFATATLYFIGGCLGWFIGGTGTAKLLGVRFGMDTQQTTLTLVAVGLMAITIGAIFSIYYALRTRLELSIAELKDAEFAHKELEIAASIQRRLLPPPDLTIDGLHIVSRHLPAQLVAGDFYDVFRLDDGRLAIVIADVSGKGMGASLIMASAKAMVPLLASGHDLPTTMVFLNQRLCADLDDRQFVALAMVWIDAASGRYELANAGLPDPYAIGPDATPRALQVGGDRLPLGVRRSAAYATATGVLEPGTRLLMLTDGVPEALTTSGGPVGYDRVVQLLSDGDGPAAEWLDGRIDAIRAATVEQADDDWTLVVIEHANLRSDRAGTADHKQSDDLGEPR